MYPDPDLLGGSVLLIDDDQLVRARLREDLGEGDLFTRFFEAENGLSGFSVLANHADEIDVIICDVEMPDFDGFKFLQMQHTREDFAAV
ncbi:MAG: response regulator, partial [Candidatus Dadabacteria bacterium]